MLLLKVNEHLVAVVKVLQMKYVDELSEADDENIDKEEVLVKPCK